MAVNRFADTPGEAAEAAARASRQMPEAERKQMAEQARAALRRPARFRPRKRGSK